MPKFLVKGQLKPGKKADLAARLKDGTLAEGAAFQEDLLSALREGHAVRDDVYFMIESRSANLTDERGTIESYFDIVNVVKVNEVSQSDFERIEREDPIPEWAGVDRED